MATYLHCGHSSINHQTLNIFVILGNLLIDKWRGESHQTGGRGDRSHQTITVFIVNACPSLLLSPLSLRSFPSISLLYPTRVCVCVWVCVCVCVCVCVDKSIHITEEQAYQYVFQMNI